MNTQIQYHVTARDVELLAAIEDGLPFCESPYLNIGEQIQMSESEVLDRLQRLSDKGVISRFGLVLQHRPLGYKANAMVVWDIPDNQVDETAASIAAHEFVTLCYCRKRRAPVWPYNLYCMIHGQERARVEQQIAELKENAKLGGFQSRTLFSRRRFKQQGARFFPASRCTKEPA